ncbi:MAG: nucleotide exchange factor GrpE [Candidatus Riflebacteria bacterium]|nr:nucleotide exchange factor GrpE [Candidatus Riflebacteria bacterium]
MNQDSNKPGPGTNGGGEPPSDSSAESVPGAAAGPALPSGEAGATAPQPRADATFGSAAEPLDVKKLRSEADDLRQQVDRWKRQAADLDNSRKRILRDRERELADQQASVLRGILPVVDNLERAMASLEKAADPEAVKRGTQQILQVLTDYLTKLGVKPIPALGLAYDPQLHEAVAHLPTADYPAGTVSAEVERGYLLGERVLRHSRVVVSSGAPGAQGCDEEESCSQGGSGTDGSGQG